MVLKARHLLCILSALDGASISDFLSSLLESPSLAKHPVVERFKLEVPSVLQLLYNCPGTCTSMVESSHKFMTQKYADEVTCLVSKANGWHFNAQHTSAEQLQAFSLMDMAQQLMIQAPLLWDLLGNLLQADPLLKCHCTKEHGWVPSQETTATSLDDRPDTDDEENYWTQLGDSESPDLQGSHGAAQTTPNSSKRQHRTAESHTALLQIVRTSICMSNYSACIYL